MAVTDNVVIDEALLQKETIRLLDNNTIIAQAANRKYEGALRSQGDTVSVQNFPNVTGYRNVTAGADITQENFTVTKEQLTVDQVLQINVPITDYEQSVSNLDLESQLASRFAFRLADTHDRHIANKAVQNANSSNVVAKATPTNIDAADNTVVNLIESMRVKLSGQNAFANAMLYITPEVASEVRNSTRFDGFREGLAFRQNVGVPTENGLMGQMSRFTIYETNSTPFRQKLGLATQVTADDTVVITIDGTAITFTFKASPAAAGEVDIGSDVEETAGNLKAAIEGGSGAGTAYIEVSAANRELLKKADVAMETWASDVSYISANQVITLAETFTDGTDAFGTAARSIFGMDREAVNFVDKLTQMKVTESTSGFNKAVLLESVWGSAVFGENAKRITVADVDNLLA